MLQLAGTAVEALSVAGLETCIQLPGFGLCFDMGVCPPSAVSLRDVLFTHAHIDHMGAVVSHCATRSLYGLPPPRYLFPEENEEALRALLEVWRKLDHSELDCVLRPVRPGEDIQLGKGLRAQTFRSIHRVPSVGYGLYKTRSRLRPEWQGAPGEELRAAKAAGEVIAEEVEALEVVFCGDTVIDVVEREPMVRTARLLILECTFVDDTVSVAGARKLGHVHLDEIIERADLFENEAILLTHLSARYPLRAAQQILARRLPASLRDRVTLLPHHRFGRAPA
jgi:ribonuclease Z